MIALSSIFPIAPKFSHKQQQVNNIAMITFWSQFSVYVFNTILILFLTRPMLTHGLGYSEARAYAFFGVTQAMGYVMPILGGQMADRVVGLTRSILVGCALLALAYLLVMLSGFSISSYGDNFFIMAYALIPVTNSLLMGTASGVVSKIYSNDNAKAKAGMTLYYMSINVGALLATIIAPKLFESRYGPLSIFAVVFIGKSIAALNYSFRYGLYEDVRTSVDKESFDYKKLGQVFLYIAVIYSFTLFSYLHPYVSSYVVASGAFVGLSWFLLRTVNLQDLEKKKQIIAILLIVEAVVFFVLYNQMNTTLVLFAKNNSNLRLLWFHVLPAHYQVINPIIIIIASFILPGFYKRFPNFSIPYQFASGTMLGGLGLIVMYIGCSHAAKGLVDGNFIVLTDVLLTIAELWVSAIGLSMIGLYCSHQMIAFAMGVWYLASSLSYIISGQVAQFVALPHEGMSPIKSLMIYQSYYLQMGVAAFLLGIFMLIGAALISNKMSRQNIKLA